VSKRSIISGRICSAACGFVSSMEVEAAGWLVEANQGRSRIADGIVPPGVSRTMIFGIASPKIVLCEALANTYFIGNLANGVAAQRLLNFISERGTGSGRLARKQPRRRTRGLESIQKTVNTARLSR